MTRFFRRIAGLATLALGLYACSATSVGPSAQPFTSNARTAPSATSSKVVIVDFSYQPAKIVVKPGTTVSFTNKDADGHTVTQIHNLFSSPILAKGSTWKHTFKKAGKFVYYCKVHTYMKGTVIVKS